MSFETAFTLVTMLGITVVLALELLSPDVLLLVALALLVVVGVIDPETAFEGFANLTLVAIGALYVVANGLRRCGALDRLADLLFGRVARGLFRTLVRMTSFVAVGSAFLNNTPIVAMGVPAIRGWARRQDVSASRLLLPLSFASILGGLCTLIGTSTNLVTDGLLRSHGLPGLGFFELAWVGVPCALVGILYLAVATPRLLPERVDARTEEERERDPLLELRVDPGSDMVGKKLDELGLLELPGLVIVRLESGARTLQSVSADERIRVGDRILYAGEPLGGVAGETLEVDEFIRQLRAATGREPGRPELHQAVIPPSSRLIGRPLDQMEFAERFGASVTGIRRGGRRLVGPPAGVVLRLGDTLMVDAAPNFREVFEDSQDLFIASAAGGEGDEAEPTSLDASTRRVFLAAGIMVSVIALAASGVLHIAISALLGALAMVVSGFMSPGEARESVDWSVLIVIGAALGLAAAMESSGAAELIGRGIVALSGNVGPVGLLAVLIAGTMLVTGLITNNAAVALLFPIAYSVAQAQGLDPRPLLISITIAASLALWTPLGYQTNLMVYGPGNYRFTDFIRLGLPLQIILGGVTLWVVTLVWPL